MEGCNQDNSYYYEFGVEVAAGYYRVDNYVDLDLASDYSWNSVVDLMVVDEAFDAEDSLEDFVVMDEISFGVDSLDNSYSLLADGSEWPVGDNLGNSSSKMAIKV